MKSDLGCLYSWSRSWGDRGVSVVSPGVLSSSCPPPPGDWSDPPSPPPDGPGLPPGSLLRTAGSYESRETSRASHRQTAPDREPVGRRQASERSRTQWSTCRSELCCSPLKSITVNYIERWHMRVTRATVSVIWRCQSGQFLAGQLWR